LLLPGTLMVMAATPQPVLTGVWGDARATLTLTPTGGAFIEECQTATLTGPVHVHDNRFTTTAKREVVHSGPQQADVAPEYTELHFQGRLLPGHIDLEIHAVGSPIERHQLIANRHTKAHRCN